MSYKKDMNEKEIEKWENIKKNITIDRKEKIYRESESLGDCSVSISFTDGKLCLEIMPIGINGAEGVIVNIDEDNCHISSIMSMIENTKQAKERETKRLMENISNILNSKQDDSPIENTHLKIISILLLQQIMMERLMNASNIPYGVGDAFCVEKLKNIENNKTIEILDIILKIKESILRDK